jgi:hypothetical protein
VVWEEEMYYELWHSLATIIVISLPLWTNGSFHYGLMGVFHFGETTHSAQSGREIALQCGTVSLLDNQGWRILLQLPPSHT